MLIASKYEEIYSPEIRDFVYMCDKAYTKEQILVQEREIFRVLDFNMTAPSIFRFLERFTKLDQSDIVVQNLARYLSELTLLDIKMYNYNPSLIAASSIYVAKKVLKRPHAWSLHLASLIGYDERTVRDCAKEICIYLNLAHTKPEYQSLFKKFSLDKFHGVAKIPLTIDPKFETNSSSS